MLALLVQLMMAPVTCSAMEPRFVLPLFWVMLPAVVRSLTVPESLLNRGWESVMMWVLPSRVPLKLVMVELMVMSSSSIKCLLVVALVASVLMFAEWIM